MELLSWPHQLRGRKSGVPLKMALPASCKLARKCHLLRSATHLQNIVPSQQVFLLPAFPMSTPAPSTSHPDDPALLRIDGAIATITLNRPTAFNAINLAIAQKLEQLGAEVEASDEIKV